MLGRGLRWLRAQACFSLVVAAFAVCVIYLLFAPGHWRRAAGLMAVALLFAAAVRGVLPSVRAGMLAVRGRVLDTATYLALGVVVLAVAIRLH